MIFFEELQLDLQLPMQSVPIITKVVFTQYNIM